MQRYKISFCHLHKQVEILHKNDAAHLSGLHCAFDIRKLSSLQVPSAAGERTDRRAHCSPVLQGEVQLAAQIPTFTLSTGGPGAKAHLPAPRGERKDVLHFKY